MNISSANRLSYFLRMLQQPPTVAAEIKGSDEYPEIRGKIGFYETAFGTLVSAQVFGLPESDCACEKRIFALHIHGGKSCTGDCEDPFADAGTHYDPENCSHPNHAGDLPPLFADSGYAFQAVLTDRFSVNEIIGKTVIVHAGPDDFATQPSGAAGEKIACGVIERTSSRRSCRC